jgi:hypothetical protein
MQSPQSSTPWPDSFMREENSLSSWSPRSSIWPTWKKSLVYHQTLSSWPLPADHQAHLWLPNQPHSHSFSTPSQALLPRPEGMKKSWAWPPALTLL